MPQVRCWVDYSAPIIRAEAGWPRVVYSGAGLGRWPDQLELGELDKHGGNGGVRDD